MAKSFLYFFIFFSFMFGAELKIASYNVENLFDGNPANSKYDDYKVCDLGCPWDKKQYEDKLKRTAKIVNDIGADIIALQEVENRDVLKDLANLTKYKYYFFAKPNGTSVGNGFLSKLPFKYTRYYPVKQTRSRDIVRVDIEFGNEIISLYNVHFPSNRNSPSTKIKAATALKDALKDGKNSVILGDFNSEYGENFILKDLISENKFFSLWMYKDKKDRFSHVSKRAIDNVLLLKSYFLDSSKVRYKEGSFEVFKKPYMFDEKGNLKKLNKKMFLYSDHYPITFELKN